MRPMQERESDLRLFVEVTHSFVSDPRELADVRAAEARLREEVGPGCLASFLLSSRKASAAWQGKAAVTGGQGCVLLDSRGRRSEGTVGALQERISGTAAVLCVQKKGEKYSSLPCSPALVPNSQLPTLPSTLPPVPQVSELQAQLAGHPLQKSVEELRAKESDLTRQVG